MLQWRDEAVRARWSFDRCFAALIDGARASEPPPPEELARAQGEVEHL
jgi:hypothetical protein